MVNPNTRQALSTVDGVDPLTIPLEPLSDNTIDLAAIEARTQELLNTLRLANGSRFPWGTKGSILYEKNLEGRPFVIVSRMVFADVEDAFNKGQMKTIARTMVRRVIPETHEFLPPQEARFQGGYIMSQLRGMTDHELIGSYKWTLARDTDASKYQTATGWEYPRKLAPYDATIDSPADITLDQTWGDAVDDMARKIAEMANAGTTIHPVISSAKTSRK